MKEVFQRGSGCPDLDELLSATLTPSVKEHLTRCPACQTELALFASFEDGQVRPDESSDLDHVLRRVASPATAPAADRHRNQTIWDHFRAWWSQTRSPVWAGAAAIAVAALVVVVSLRTQLVTTTPSGSLPATENNTWRGSDLTFQTPLGDLESLPSEIRWTSVSGAAAYGVSLKEIDGTRVFYKKITRPMLAMDSDLATLMRSGKVYLLTVVALSSNDRTLGEAGPARVRVLHKPSSQK